jgi:hypothetical protein
MFFALSNFNLNSQHLKTKQSQAQTLSPDAIAIRVMPNQNHLSALSWYKSKSFKGSPQSIIIDGYEGIRDGRTSYVNAANVILGDPDTYYTNIYIISHTQDAEQATKDIFSEILKHWKFNVNISKSETRGHEQAHCSENPDLYCIADQDCGDQGYCNSYKATVTRDTIRIARLNDIKEKIEEYAKNNNHYPKMNSGTYIPGISLSTWPSWQRILGQTIGETITIDPINRFKNISDCTNEEGYNKITCWNEKEKEFLNANSTILKEEASLNPGSFVFMYKTENEGENYKICAYSESGFISPDESCSIGDCIPQCFNKECGDNFCEGYCGTCPSNTSCVHNKCQKICEATLAETPQAGCQSIQPDNSSRVPGYCPLENEYCYFCQSHHLWDTGLNNCRCVPYRDCPTYPEECGGAMSDGCDDILHCENNCELLDNSICCDEKCKELVCAIDTDCDDGNLCTIDTCINTDPCDVHCIYNPKECPLDQICCEGICQEPECKTNNDCVVSNDDLCNLDVCTNEGTCEAQCAHPKQTLCLYNDGCCPNGCNGLNDNDCCIVSDACKDTTCQGANCYDA